MDVVCNAVRNGQSLFELQRDGWYMGEIHEAVGIWYELGLSVRSQEKGFFPATGLWGGDLAAVDISTDNTYFAAEVGYGKKTFEGLLDCRRKTAAGPKGFFSLYAGFGVTLGGIIVGR